MTDARDIIARQLDDSGNTFSAAWTLGHLACVADLFSSLFSGELLLDAAFHRVFNDTDIAVAGPGKTETAEAWSKMDLFLKFQQAMIKALRVLAAFDISQWDTPAPPGTPRSLATGGAIWEHLSVHTYWHLGELAGSMPRFAGTYTLNPVKHYLYVPPE